MLFLFHAVDLYTKQSSANSLISMNPFNYIYTEKRVGPRTESCGTPEDTLHGEERQPSTTMHLLKPIT